MGLWGWSADGGSSDLFLLTWAGDIFYTPNFDDAAPTWSVAGTSFPSLTTPTGRNPLLKIDPHNRTYQYFMNGDGKIYSKSKAGADGAWSLLADSTTFGGDAGLILTSARKAAGWLGVVYAKFDSGPIGGGADPVDLNNYKLYFIDSNDYGASWNTAVLIGSFVSDSTVLFNNGATQFTMGVHKGSSAFAAGAVIWVWTINWKDSGGASYQGHHDLWVSTDSGATWTKEYDAPSTNAVTFPYFNTSGRWFAIDSSSQDCAIVVSNFGSASMDSWRSTDYGANWTDVYAGAYPDDLTAPTANYQGVSKPQDTGASSKTWYYFNHDDYDVTEIARNKELIKYVSNGSVTRTNTAGAGLAVGTTIDTFTNAPYKIYVDSETGKFIALIDLFNHTTEFSLADADAIIYVSTDEGANWSGKSSLAQGLTGNTSDGVLDIAYRPGGAAWQVI